MPRGVRAPGRTTTRSAAPLSKPHLPGENSEQRWFIFMMAVFLVLGFTVIGFIAYIVLLG
jgi:hypothetical protein